MKYPTNSKYNFFDPSSGNFKVYLTASCYEVRSTVNFLQGPFCFPDIWILDYSLDVESFNRVNDSVDWDLRPANCAHLYPPGCTYWDKPLEEQNVYRGAYIMFAGGKNVGLNKYVNNPKGFCRFYDDLGIIGDLLVQSANMLAPLGEAGFLTGQSYLYRIIDALHHSVHSTNGWERHATLADEKGAGADVAFVRSVRQYLQDNYTRNLSLDEIAQTMNVSKSTLSHKFRTISGQSPFQALIAIRVNAVKALLLKRERLKNIAEETGFYDEYHLSKMFKTFTGTSPREFIQRHCEKLT